MRAVNSCLSGSGCSDLYSGYLNVETWFIQCVAEVPFRQKLERLEVKLNGLLHNIT